MNLWKLPRKHTIGGTPYDLNTDYRDILEIIEHLNNEAEPEFIRWRIAVALFYEQDVPENHMQEAMEYLAEFISAGTADKKPGPKLLDWAQDAQMIVSGINKVAGKEIRAVEYLHWWTFISLFQEVGEGQLSTIVSIRHKRATGKKLEKWEQEYYNENRDKVDFQKPIDPEEEAVKAYFNKWL